MDRDGAVKLVASIILCELMGVFGSFFSLQTIPTWYAGLAKPSFTPPDWVFGPAWTILYFLMGVALYLVWSKGLKNENVIAAVQCFEIQLMLNLGWSILFFGLQSTVLGMVSLVALLVAISVTILKFYRISKPAAGLMAVYLLWALFATLLNAYLLVLN